MAGDLADTPFSLRDALPGADDPDVRRVRAIVQSRLLGEAPVPARIDRFVLIEKVGEGGMGVVLAAFDPQLDRKVAIKLLRRGHEDARIVREAQAMAKLSHPNVAQVYEVGTHEGRTFIAMEFARGDTLRRWIAEQTRSWEEVVARYVEAGRGLAAAHAAGLVHRDFKPDNALVGDDRVRVVDFGLAREDAMSEPSSPANDTSPTTSVAGTPRYMAPEHRAGGDADAKSDQYSFCVSLWEALHGELPFKGAKTAAPAWIRAAITRGLSMTPADRFASMPALLAALTDDPSRKRRRWLVLGAAALLVTGGVSAWALERAAAARACEADADSIAQTWGPGPREQLRDAVLGTKLAYAADTWPRLDRQLTAYADGWAEARERSCLAADVEDTRSDELASRTTACLDDRRDALAALIDVLSTSEPPPLSNALQAAYQLPAVEPCSDDGWLLARPRPPDDAAVRELARQLVRSEWLRMTVDTAAHLEDARSLATRAEALGWAPLHARALFNLGAYQSEALDHESADANLHEAVTVAMHGNAEEIAVDASVGMVVSAVMRGDNDEALWWGWLAQTLLERAPDPSREVHLLGQLAGVHQRRRAFAEADAVLVKALATAEVAFGEEHPLVARTLSHLGLIRGEQGRHAEALALLQRTLALQERALGPDHPQLVQTLGGIGSTHFMQETWIEAIPAFERAIAIAEGSHGPEHPIMAELLNVLASAYAGAGQHERGATTRARALTIAERVYGPQGRGLVEILVNRGAVHSDRGELDAAMADFERVLAILETSGESETMDAALVLGNIAQVHDLRGDPARAVELFPRALQLMVAALGEDHVQVASVVEQAGVAHEHLGQYPQAATQAERALAICSRTDCRPALRATATALLARARWHDEASRAQAIDLMHQARAHAQTAGNATVLATIDEWLAAHAI